MNTTDYTKGGKMKRKSYTQIRKEECRRGSHRRLKLVGSSAPFVPPYKPNEWLYYCANCKNTFHIPVELVLSETE